MQQPNYSVLGSAEDQFSLMTFLFNETITPGDTIDIYTVLTTVWDGSSADLLNNVAKAKKWLFDHIVSCDTSCCQNRGNADGIVGVAGPIDVADLTYLVAYLFQGGEAPPCEEEGNIDGIVGVGGPIDVADLTYLVAYLFQGGAAPPACP